jgi:hypothetical protein
VYVKNILGAFAFGPIILYLYTGKRSTLVFLFFYDQATSIPQPLKGTFLSKYGPFAKPFEL